MFGQLEVIWTHIYMVIWGISEVETLRCLQDENTKLPMCHLHEYWGQKKFFWGKTLSEIFLDSCLRLQEDKKRPRLHVMIMCQMMIN